MNTITIKIRAKHLIDKNYESCTDCALASAIKDQLNTSAINIGPFESEVNGVWYKASYGPDEFDTDQKKAKAAKHPDTIIRTINLVPVILQP